MQVISTSFAVFKAYINKSLLKYRLLEILTKIIAFMSKI